MTIDSNLHWILSFYRTSEIGGALFFGELARSLRPSAIQQDMTRHFADEANHARYWTDCMAELGVQPLKLATAYQNQYLAAAGMPANLMEILAITQVFEKRVVAQYALHGKSPNTPEPVRRTLETIMTDEQWHIRWIRDALAGMEGEYGADHIRATLRRFTLADREVYRRTALEHRERVRELKLAHK
jgi:hypothetical protein